MRHRHAVGYGKQKLAETMVAYWRVLISSCLRVRRFAAQLTEVDTGVVVFNCLLSVVRSHSVRKQGKIA